MNYNQKSPRGEQMQKKYKVFIDNYHRLCSQNMTASSKEYEFMKLDALLNKKEIEDYLLELNHKFGFSKNIYENMADSYSAIMKEIETRQQALAQAQSTATHENENISHKRKKGKQGKHSPKIRSTK